MSNNIFSNLFARFAPKSEAEAAQPLQVESAVAEVGNFSNTDGNVTVTVRYRLVSESFTIKAGSKMSQLFELVAQRFSIGSLAQVSVLDEATNNAASFEQVKDQPIVADSAIAVEDTAGTAG